MAQTSISTWSRAPEEPSRPRRQPVLPGWGRARKPVRPPSTPLPARSFSAIPRPLPLPRRVEGSTAVHPQALPGGVDLILAPTPSGFKESVILPDVKAPTTYVDEFAMPEGVTAAQGTEGVEFLDKEGTVVGLFRDGFAYDASFPESGIGATAPVAVRLRRRRRARPPSRCRCRRSGSPTRPVSSPSPSIPPS